MGSTFWESDLQGRLGALLPKIMMQRKEIEILCSLLLKTIVKHVRDDRSCLN